MRFLGILSIILLAVLIYMIVLKNWTGVLTIGIMFIPSVILWIYSNTRQSTKERVNLK